MPKVIPPKPTPDDQWFWDGVAQDRLLLRRCAPHGHLQHPPTPTCPQCGSLEWQPFEAEGTGTVQSWMVSIPPGDRDTAYADGRVVVIVELAEGVRFVANLVGIAVDEITFGLPVQVGFADVEGVRLPQFRPVAVSS